MASSGLFIGENSDIYCLFASLSVARMSFRLDHAINFRQAIDMIKGQPESHYQFIVICLPPIDEAPEFLKFLKETGQEIPVLFTADENTLNKVHDLLPMHPLCSRICYSMGEKVVTNALRRIIKVKEKHIRSQEDYCPLPITFFSKLERASFDTYIKHSEEKYVLIFRKGMPFDIQRIEQYQKKSCLHLYLKDSDYLTASSEIFSKIAEKVKPKVLQTQKLTSLAKLANSTVHTAIGHLGIKEEALKIADVGIQAAVELTDRLDKDLAKHLKRIAQGKDYHSEHTLLAIFIATAISKEIEWISEATRDKIVYSLFFHDIATDDIELSQADDPRTIPNLSEKRLQKYLFHPKEAADMLEKVSNLPMDIGRIILLHHEKPDGSGFPYGLDWKKVFPLAAIINISHELAKVICHCGLENNFLEDLFDELEEVYSKGNYKTAMEGARKAFGLFHRQIEQMQKKVS